MALVLRQISAASEEPLNLQEVKQFLRVDHNDDDNLILGLITVARERAENITHRALITQTWQLYLDDWPNEDYIELPYPPLQGVVSVYYVDYEGTATLWAATNYDEDVYIEPGRLMLAYGIEWPTVTLDVGSAIRVQYTCGYGTPDDVPIELKHAMKLHIADLYEMRTTYTKENVGRIGVAEQLYMPWRIFSF